MRETTTGGRFSDAARTSQDGSLTLFFHKCAVKKKTAAADGLQRNEKSQPHDLRDEKIREQGIIMIGKDDLRFFSHRQGEVRYPTEPLGADDRFFSRRVAALQPHDSSKG